MTLEHGGNVGAAARRFNIPVAQWLDLSTGISPWTWPVPIVPAHIWQTLPYDDEQLARAAAAYYGCSFDAVLAVPGSQYALQFVPGFIPGGRVAMPVRGYAEHRAAWTQAGHQIVEYTDGAALLALVAAKAVEHALVINPNNPTTELLSRQLLLELREQLLAVGGYLVVDEAFADSCPQASLADLCPSAGLIVYRSIGKFFGLAGLRLGFMLAPCQVREQLKATMPPWLLSHPARWIGAAALADKAWQAEQQRRLAQSAAQWLQILSTLVPRLGFSGTTLFASGSGDAAYCDALYQALARRAVLIRQFEQADGQGMLRFGLPLPTVREQLERLIRESVEECACDFA